MRLVISAFVTLVCVLIFDSLTQEERITICERDVSSVAIIHLTYFHVQFGACKKGSPSWVFSSFVKGKYSHS